LTDKDINIVLTREPGGSAIGEKIRTLLLSNSTGEIHADTELMLMFAARNEHIQNKIMPALAQGKSTNKINLRAFSCAFYAVNGDEFSFSHICVFLLNETFA
jgi:dTMP kinase